jgi:germination protein YpeB
MTESYYEISDGILYINFAAKEGNVILYPDLIKIGVSLESGEILSFDARGYLVNHTDRNLSAPTISNEEAKTHLPSSVSVISSRLALTPGRNTEERLCYEFRCKGKRDENLLIYIDALSGDEVSVLILLIGENGTLSI